LAQRGLRGRERRGDHLFYRGKLLGSWGSSQLPAEPARNQGSCVVRLRFRRGGIAETPPRKSRSRRLAQHRSARPLGAGGLRITLERRNRGTGRRLARKKTGTCADNATNATKIQEKEASRLLLLFIRTDTPRRIDIIRFL
jgi:hypothetical protein